MGTVTPVRGSNALRSAPAEAQTLAKGLALAMADPSIRGQVHAAMRGSTFNEHKLVFQEFVTTPAGERVLAAVSNALGQSLSSTKSMVASLPALDFYLPFETHRQTWKSSSDVYVATTFEKRAPSVTAYGTNGQILELRQADGVPTVRLIILHPAEPKIHTVPGNSPLDLIESPPTTARTSVPQHNLIYCGDTCGGGGGSCCSTSSPPGTYISHFNIKADDGWFGSEEMRFRSYAVAGHWVFVQGSAGSNYLVADYLCPKGTYSQDGVKQSQGYDGLYLISPTVYKGSYLTCNGYPATYAINIVEVDGDLNGKDDDYGWRIYDARGYYPSGATYDVVYSYYGNTYPAIDDNRSAYLRITIY